MRSFPVLSLGRAAPCVLLVAVFSLPFTVSQSSISAELESCSSPDSQPQVCVPSVFNPVVLASTVLNASGTCGPNEQFCSFDIETGAGGSTNEGGCSICRSKFDYRADLVRTDRGKFQRWQSDVLKTVTTRMDLEVTTPTNHANLIVFSVTFNLGLDKPLDMAIEGVASDGVWRPWLYLSRDCQSTPFSSPGVPCQDFNLTIPTETFVRTTVDELNTSLSDAASHAAFIAQYGGVRGIRLAFLRSMFLGLPKPENNARSAFYSVSHLEMEAMCDCNGHASSCTDGQCSCEHGTEGPGCEKCVPYQEPYLAASYSDANACFQDINDCVGVTCQNGGTCEDMINSWMCNCSVGFTGNNCQTNIDDCVDVQCMNNSMCVDAVNNFTCQCNAGFTGPRCDLIPPSEVTSDDSDNTALIAGVVAGVLFLLLLILLLVFIMWKRSRQGHLDIPPMVLKRQNTYDKIMYPYRGKVGGMVQREPDAMVIENMSKERIV